MSNPFVDAAGEAGAAAVYVMADEDGGQVPDASGNGRGALLLGSGVELQASAALAAFDRIAWFSAGSGARAHVPWASWMDQGDTFTWVVVGRSGYWSETSQASFANVLSIGNSFLFLRSNGGSSREIEAVVRNVSPQGGYASAAAQLLRGDDYENRTWHTFGLRSVDALPEGWVDGELRSEASFEAAYGVGGPDARLCLGARYHNGSWGRHWRGHIAAVAAFPTALSAETMEALHVATRTEPVVEQAYWRIFHEGALRPAKLIDPDWQTPPPPPPPPDPEDPDDAHPGEENDPDGGSVFVAQLDLAQSGSGVQATFALWSETAVTIEQLTVAVRDSSQNNLDFGQRQNVALQAETVRTFTSSRTLTSGRTYEVWIAYYDGSRWVNPDPVRTWTQP